MPLNYTVLLSCSDQASRLNPRWERPPSTARSPSRSLRALLLQDMVPGKLAIWVRAYPKKDTSSRRLYQDYDPTHEWIGLGKVARDSQGQLVQIIKGGNGSVLEWIIIIQTCEVKRND